jgi:hypothetical protein
MRDLTRHPHLHVELREARGILVDRVRQEFQRDGLSELQVVGAEHLAHAAASKPADDPVAALEERAGRKAPVIDRVGARQPGRVRRSARAGACSNVMASHLVASGFRRKIPHISLLRLVRRPRQRRQTSRAERG